MYIIVTEKGDLLDCSSMRKYQNVCDVVSA